MNAFKTIVGNFLILALLVACKSGQQVTPHSVIIDGGDGGEVTSVEDAGANSAAPISIQRTDLPNGWREVSFDNWSYGVPGDYGTTMVNSGTVLVMNSSENTKISVSFEKFTTERATLNDYVLTDFVLGQIKNNNQVIQQASRKLDDGNEMIVVQTLSPPPSTIQTNSLDFFQKRDQSIYHLKCQGNVNAFYTHSDACFDIADTLKIK